jgi:hypothetical protein
MHLSQATIQVVANQKSVLSGKRIPKSAVAASQNNVQTATKAYPKRLSIDYGILNEYVVSSQRS